ncbi:MAG TPA: site-2 protease family protein [Humisphaera sp.]
MLQAILNSITETGPSLLLLALGFGFVVFWHELGHFLAAKWAGVRVEQFAVGFAHAIVAWRKGVGFRLGSTQKEYRAKAIAHLNERNGVKPGDPEPEYTDSQVATAGDALGLGETEYRLNWLPLGGYVKMLGQDDLRPNSEADDPKAYNRKPVGKRMVIVSAGVIMNVILAAIGFVILFSMGFNVPKAVVGTMAAGSPYQLAGGQVGDQILYFEGKDQHDDFTKVSLNSALAASNEDIPVVVRRLGPDGKEQTVTLTIKPQKTDNGGVVYVNLGIGNAHEMRGDDVAAKGKGVWAEADRATAYSKNTLLIEPGDVITAVNGTPMRVTDYARPADAAARAKQDADKVIDAGVFEAAVQTGRKVTLTVKPAAGEVKQVDFTPSFGGTFGKPQFDLAGFVPRQAIDQSSNPTSYWRTWPLRQVANSGDVLQAVKVEGTQDLTPVPSFLKLREVVNAAVKANKKVQLTVLRNGQPVELQPVEPISIQRGLYGLGVGLKADDTAAVVADVVPNSPAAVAGVPARAAIRSVAGQPVANWREFHLALREKAVATPEGFSVDVGYTPDGAAEPKSATMKFAKADADAIRQVRYSDGLPLVALTGVREASGIGQAMKWGLEETRDFILQFYLTLRRMATGDVSAGNLMGPVGILQTGTGIAAKGSDWLIWFLSMISANLAVVNFLPIPIVDGGLFTFLILEKLKGKPASPKVQAVAQYVGLALLLSIFVFVTYQDIANFAFRMR